MKVKGLVKIGVKSSIICALAAALAGALVFGCASGAAPMQAIGTVYELTVLHTNDHHGTTVSKDGKMGLAERAAFVKSVRAEHENVLVLDAGDVNTGTALSNMFDAEPDIRAYGLIGYDAVCFGNHEFDNPPDVLAKQIAWAGEAGFTWVSANVKTQGGKSFIGKPYIIKDFVNSGNEGFRVAVIGLTTLRTVGSARFGKDYKFLPEIEAARAMVKQVRVKEKANIVIILSHLGDIDEGGGHVTSVKLAESVEGVDLIVDGHSHSSFQEPKIVNNVPIVSAFEWGKVVGEGIFRLKDGKIAGFEWKPVEITSEAFTPDADLAALLAPYEAKAAEALQEVVFTASGEFPFTRGSLRLPRCEESALADLCADAFVWGTRELGQTVDFGFINGGGIRGGLPAGPVTRGDFLVMQPFSNSVDLITLTGAQVKAVFAHAAAQNQGNGGFAQVSKEVKFTITYDGEGKNGSIDLEKLTIGGKPVDDGKTYRVATYDFIVETGGDGYTMFMEGTDLLNTSVLDVDMLIAYVKTLSPPLLPQTDGRITVVGGIQPGK